MIDPHGTEVSFLLTDVEGSTRLWMEDAEAMWDSLEQHDDILRAAIKGHRGFVFTTAGDSFAAAFTHPTEALMAALEARDRLATADWGQTGPLRVRFAIHFGFARFRDGDYFGPAVNRCARMLERVAGGAVVSSQAVKDAAEWRWFDWDYMGCLPLRDFPKGEHLYAVEWQRRARRVAAAVREAHTTPKRSGEGRAREQG